MEHIHVHCIDGMCVKDLCVGGSNPIWLRPVITKAWLGTYVQQIGSIVTSSV